MLGGKEAIVLFALRIEENDGGKTLNFILFGIGLVLFGEGLVALRVVEFDENKVFRSLRGEALFGEDILAHHLARGTPIGARELDENAFVFLFRFREGGFQVRGPVFIRSDGR